jgi:hydrogenase maturation factor
MIGLIPERFGCASKLNLNEIANIRQTLRDSLPGLKLAQGDARQLTLGSELFATTIDRVFTVGLPATAFAEVALIHCCRDLLAVGATPLYGDVSFEFGIDLDESGRAELSRAVFDVCVRRGVEIGKCHSSYSHTTSLTFSLIGKIIQTAPPRQETLSAGGIILLTEKIGKLLSLYNAALLDRTLDCSDFTGQCSKDYDELLKIAQLDIAAWTDVSGYGLIGALATLTEQHEICVHLEGNPTNWLLQPAVPIPPCLLSDITGLPLPNGQVGPLNEVGALREICGPMVILTSFENASNIVEAGKILGLDILRIGTFEGAKR